MELLRDLEPNGTKKELPKTADQQRINPPLPDYLFRERIQSQEAENIIVAGPIYRKFISKKEWTHDRQIVNWCETSTVVYVPEQLVKTCLRLYHEGLGHPGIERTRATVRLNYYWPTMYQDVRMKTLQGMHILYEEKSR